MKVFLILFLTGASLLAIATLVYVIKDMIRERKTGEPNKRKDKK